MTEAELLEAMHTGVWTAALDDEDYTYAAPPPVAVSAAELAQLRADLAAALAHIDAVPVAELRRWMDYSYIEGTVNYDRAAAVRDFGAIFYWLDGDEGDGVPPAGTGVGPADVRAASARAEFIEALSAQLDRITARADAAEAQLASVPVDALRWIDRARTSGTWSSIEGPPAYAALHEWLAQQSAVQP